MDHHDRKNVIIISSQIDDIKVPEIDDQMASGKNDVPDIEIVDKKDKKDKKEENDEDEEEIDSVSEESSDSGCSNCGGWYCGGGGCGESEASCDSMIDCASYGDHAVQKTREDIKQAYHEKMLAGKSENSSKYTVKNDQNPAVDPMSASTAASSLLGAKRNAEDMLKNEKKDENGEQPQDIVEARAPFVTRKILKQIDDQDDRVVGAENAIISA